MRILFLFTISFAKYPVCIVIFGVYFTILSAIVAIVKPYQVKWHNTLDILCFQLSTCAIFLCLSHIYIKPVEPQLPIQKIFVWTMGVMAIIAFIYGGIAIFKNLIPKKILLCVRKRLKLTKDRQRQEEQQVDHYIYRFEGDENRSLIEQ